MNINMRTEPIAILAAIEVAAIAIIAAVGVALEWDSEFVASTVGLVSAAVIVVATYLQRRQVDSPATVAQKVDDALNTPVPEGGDGPTDGS